MRPPTNHTTSHTTRLDHVRPEAADRQRRADAYRTARPAGPSSDRVPVAVVAVLLLALALGTWLLPAADAADAPATTSSDTVPLPHGQLPGHADGWFDPASPQVLGVVIVADDQDSAGATAPHGYAPGRADGWFTPAVPAPTGSRDTGLAEPSVPRGVR